MYFGELLRPDHRKRLAERLQEIEEKAVNYGGYYVLEEETKIEVFSTGRKIETLAECLRHYKGGFCCGTTYYRQDPTTKKYGAYLGINKTAKKTLQHFKAFLDYEKEHKYNEY